MHASDPPLDPHGIPGQIEVDHMVAELQIDAFAAGFRRDHDLRLAAEQIHHPVLLAAVHSAPVRYGDEPMIAEIIKQVFLRGAVFREYDDLLVHLLDQLDGFPPWCWL